MADAPRESGSVTLRDIQHFIIKPQILQHLCAADLGILAQDLDAGFLRIVEALGVDAQLQQRTDHAVALLSADDAFLDLAAGQLCSGQRHDDLLSRRHIGRAADDLANIAADIDLAHMQVIAVRMVHTAFDMADDEVGGLRALFDAFHFQSGIGDALSDLLDGQIAEIHILT